MPGVSNAVFLSYASEDAEAAERIATALRAAVVEVWFDKSELRGGDVWDEKIRREIHDCSLFIPVISANTAARHEGYFRLEWDLADQRSHMMAHSHVFVVPVCLDATTEAAADVPESFKRVQWTRLPGGRTSPGFVEQVQRLLAPEGPTSRATAMAMPFGFTTAETPGKRVSALGRFKLALWVISAALAVALSYFVADKFWLSKRTAAAMASTAPASANAPEKSIAVLPFVDLSEKHDQEYFADGMAEEVIDLLGKLPGLRVIGRSSSFQFRGRSVDIRSVGDALHVAYVLEGSVRRSGDQVRVTAQLISTQDGAHRWSDTYDAKLEDVLKVQDAIAANLARTLEVAVVTMSDADRSSVDSATYELFMQGRQAYDVWTQEGLLKAAALFNEVLRRDPKFLRAREALAWTYSVIGAEGWMPPSEAFGKARETALQVLQVDPKDAVAHTVLADVHMTYDWDWEAAEREISAALRLGERDQPTLNTAMRIAATQGKWDQALQFGQEGLSEDPLDATMHMILGYWIYQRMGRDAEAEAHIRRALQIRPQWGSGRYFLAICLLTQGRLQEALHEAENEAPQDGKFQAMSAVLFAMHRKSDSDVALEKAVKESEADWPVSIAKLYAFRGEPDNAIAWLERAYQFHDEDLYYIKWDPQLRGLEDNPRYKAFLRKLNLPE